MISCSLALFDASNSTGNVTNWNNAVANKITIDSFKYPVTPANKDTIKPKYPNYDMKFTIGTNALLILKKL